MSCNDCQFTWLKQKETLVSLAESLLKDGEFFDCQLCAEGHYFNVHRVILSCNSPVFNKILQEHTSDLPVITLEGISSLELGALVEFMYTGITRISPSSIRNFFQIAKSLQLAGLSHFLQNEKIFLENGVPISETDSQDNYEIYSQNILKYLNQSEESVGCKEKDFVSLHVNSESMFLDESSETGDIGNGSEVIYEKYDSGLIKVEHGDEVETLEAHIAETADFHQACITDSNEINEEEEGEQQEEEVNTSQASLIYDKYHNVFVKNEDKEFNENNTVYSISSLDNFDSREDNEYVEFQEDVKVADEDENFVYVKLEENPLEKLRNTVARRKVFSKNDVRFFKKCVSVAVPTEKSFSVRRPKNSSLVAKDTKANADDRRIYICLKCGNKYSHRRTLLHHIHWICEQPATYSCSLCPYRGKRKFQLKSHMKHAHLLKMS